VLELPRALARHGDQVADLVERERAALSGNECTGGIEVPAQQLRDDLLGIDALVCGAFVEQMVTASHPYAWALGWAVTAAPRPGW
jgi:hypothetical protein